MNKRFVAMVVAAGVLATGCSMFSLSPEAEEEAYLLRVAQAEAPWLAAIQRFDRTLSSSYSTRTVFLKALRDAGLAEGARDSLDAAQALTPPASLAGDHAHWLKFRATVNEVAPELTASTTSGDVVYILAVRRSLGEAEGDFLLSIGRLFCIHLEAVDPARDCPPDGTLPGGQYGTSTYETLREYAIRVGPMFLTSGGLDQGQQTSYLAGVQPDIETLLATTGEALSHLDPPAEFAADHEALLSYFEDQHATALEITAANAIGNSTRIAELYTQSGQLVENLRQTLSDAVRPIVAPAF